MPKEKTWSFILLFLLVNAGPLTAQAGLGGKLDSPPHNRKQLSAYAETDKVEQFPNYSMHAMDFGGTEVREFVDKKGEVFAVAWTGITHPDLSILLGRYAKEYNQRIQAPRRPSGQRFSQLLKTEHIVVEKSGHMRQMQGRAYALDLFPSGVTLNEIK